MLPATAFKVQGLGFGGSGFRGLGKVSELLGTFVCRFALIFRAAAKKIPASPCPHSKSRCPHSPQPLTSIPG